MRQELRAAHRRTGIFLVLFQDITAMDKLPCVSVPKVDDDRLALLFY